MTFRERPATATRLAAIERAVVAGHLGEWQIGRSAVGCLEAGLRLAASRFAAFPEADCHRSRDELLKAAVDQVLQEFGLAHASADDRRRAVMEVFNFLGNAIELAGFLGGSDPTAEEQPSANRAPQPIAKHWPSGWQQRPPHTFPHRSR